MKSNVNDIPKKKMLGVFAPQDLTTKARKLSSSSSTPNAHKTTHSLQKLYT